MRKVIQKRNWRFANRTKTCKVCGLLQMYVGGYTLANIRWLRGGSGDMLDHAKYMWGSHFGFLTGMSGMSKPFAFVSHWGHPQLGAAFSLVKRNKITMYKQIFCWCMFITDISFRNDWIWDSGNLEIKVFRFAGSPRKLEAVISRACGGLVPVQTRSWCSWRRLHYLWSNKRLHSSLTRAGSSSSKI